MDMASQIAAAEMSFASDDLLTLNSAAFGGEHIQSALLVLRCLPREEQFDAEAQAAALRDYVTATGIASPIAAAALHARLIAFNRWAAAQGPRHENDAMTMMDAAATCPLIETDKGIGFDAGRFAETMALVADLPW